MRIMWPLSATPVSLQHMTNSVARHPSQMNVNVISSPLSGCDVSIPTLFIPRNPDCRFHGYHSENLFTRTEIQPVADIQTNIISY